MGDTVSVVSVVIFDVGLVYWKEPIMSVMSGFGVPSPMQQVSSAILGSVMSRMNQNPEERKLSGIAVGHVAIYAANDLVEQVKSDRPFMADPGVPDKTKDAVSDLRQLQQELIKKMGTTLL